MSKRKKNNKSKNKKTLSKIGLGAGGAALLGMALGGSVYAEEEGVSVAPRRVTRVTTVPAERIVKDARYELNENEKKAWEDQNVQAAYAFVSKLSMEEQLKFLEDSDKYARENNFDERFGISTGTEGDGVRQFGIDAIAKKLRMLIIEKFLDPGQFTASSW